LAKSQTKVIQNGRKLPMDPDQSASPIYLDSLFFVDFWPVPTKQLLSSSSTPLIHFLVSLETTEALETTKASVYFRKALRKGLLRLS